MARCVMEIGTVAARLGNTAPHQRAPWKSLIQAVERSLAHRFFRRPPPACASGRLNLGCGSLRYEGWVNADLYNFVQVWRGAEAPPDWMLDATRPWRCPDDHWTGVFSQHMLEHVSYRNAVFVLREIHRTLKPGHWLRLSVPDIDRFAGDDYAKAGAFASRPEAISYITQHFEHLSVWNNKLMIELLTDLGFQDVRACAFGEGMDPALLRDQEVKRPESLWVEARKP